MPAKTRGRIDWLACGGLILFCVLLPYLMSEPSKMWAETLLTRVSASIALFLSIVVALGGVMYVLERHSQPAVRSDYQLLVRPFIEMQLLFLALLLMSYLLGIALAFFIFTVMLANSSLNTLRIVSQRDTLRHVTLAPRFAGWIVGATQWIQMMGFQALLMNRANPSVASGWIWVFLVVAYVITNVILYYFRQPTIGIPIQIVVGLWLVQHYSQLSPLMRMGMLSMVVVEFVFMYHSYHLEKKWIQERGSNHD